MARYVLLRIADDQEADDFLRDVALYPHSPLLTPVQENTVHVELVPGKDPSDGTVRGRNETKAQRLETTLRASVDRASELAAEWEMQL